LDAQVRPTLTCQPIGSTIDRSQGGDFFFGRWGFFLAGTIFGQIDRSQMLGIFRLVVHNFMGFGILRVLYTTKFTMTNSPFPVWKPCSKFSYSMIIGWTLPTNNGIIDMST
jgi:hypothetical protein